jgi:hypothetical protein
LALGSETVTKSFLRNPDTGKLTAYKIADIIPSGWDLVKKVYKKKAKQAPSVAKAKDGPTPGVNLIKARMKQEAEHRWKSK